MRVELRLRSPDAGARRSLVRRRLSGRAHPAGLWAIVFACCFTCQLHGDPPSVAEFPELLAAYRPIDGFVSAKAIFVDKDEPGATTDLGRSCDPFPAGSRILAYEENSRFLFATGDASHIFEASQPDQAKPAFVRRFLFLKPSVFVVDDFVRNAGSDRSLRWLLEPHSPMTEAGGGLRFTFTAGDQELVWEILWPGGELPKRTPESPEAAEPVSQMDSVQLEAVPEAGAKEVRWLHVFHLRKAGDDGGSVKSVLENKDGVFELVISSPDRVYRLALPPSTSPSGRCPAEAGRIAIEAADGKTIVASRPLPSGVLPHGPQGVRLVERWDSAYRDGRRPPWDTGLPAEDLKKVVEEGVVRPCRTVVVGCGSGTNAIYLAEKGFDVTAIDVAPTALGIARAKAEKAGVRVRWVLADVLALPDLEPFDFLFDRGCYHNVRYADAAGFVESVRRLSSQRRPGTRCLILSLNREGPPGVLESHMRDDFSSGFEFEWLRKSDIQTGDNGKNRRASWSLMLRRTEGD